MATVPRQASTIASKHNDLVRRVHGLEAGMLLKGGVTIDKGGLTVIDPNNGDPFFVLKLEPLQDGSGRQQMIFALYREDGSLAFVLGDLGTTPGHTFEQALQWFDRAGNIIVADDTTSGQGLARPYLSMGTFVDDTVPTATTTSTTFATLQTLSGFKQHPKIFGQILTYSDTGTTGTIQLVDQSSNVLFTTNLASGQFSYVTFGPVALAGVHEAGIVLSIQGKVLTGTGKVGARGVSAIGVQT